MIKEIATQIEQHSRFLVVAHENPDGDAIGSTLGLTIALQEMGKQVTAVNIDGVPESMHFLPHSELIVEGLPDGERFDCAFVIDAGELERTGVEVCSCSDQIINIDHHPHSNFGDLRYVDTGASATAVLIYRLLQQLAHQPSLAVAKALYLGIMADTGSFRYSSANAETFSVAGQLIACGVDSWEIANQLYESYPAERMRLLGAVLPTLEISSCGRYAAVSMTRDDIVRTKALEEYADGFVNYPRAVRGVEVALFFNQQVDGQVKISFRSRGAIDVGRIARDLGGGGHHNAAGVKLSGSLKAVKERVIELLDQHFSEMV